LLGLLAVILTAPLGYRLADQLRKGQTRPYTLPVSQSVRQTIKERVHQEYGVTFISASRFVAESDRDVAILLSAAKPVSINLISDLKKLVNQKIEKNVTVAVYVLQEAEIERRKF
jgi:phosphoserine phosphatase